MISPELQTQITNWRHKAKAGTITLDEMKQAILHLRQNRMASAVAAAKSTSGKRSKKAPAKTADELFDELGKL